MGGGRISPSAPKAMRRRDINKRRALAVKAQRRCHFGTRTSPAGLRSRYNLAFTSPRRLASSLQMRLHADANSPASYRYSDDPARRCSGAQVVAQRAITVQPQGPAMRVLGARRMAAQLRRYRRLLRRERALPRRCSSRRNHVMEPCRALAVRVPARCRGAPRRDPPFRTRSRRPLGVGSPYSGDMHTCLLVACI